jgi:hypothetical protein
MTGPKPQDPRITQNVTLMQGAKWDDAKIQNYLRNIEHVDPADYASNGPGLGQQLLHGAGLIGRMGVQGIGNLASLPFGMAGAAYQGVTGNEPPAMLQGNQGTNAANELGLPQYQGAGERIIGAAGENAVMSAVMPGACLGMTALGAGAGAAGQAATEAGAGPLGQMAASAVVGMGIPIVGTMGAAAIRSAVAGSSARREAARQSQALLQAGNPNAPMTLGQVAEGGMARTIEGGLRNIPGASGTFQRVLGEQADGMSQRATRIADGISGGGTPTSAGATVQRGISEGFVPRFKATANDLYKKVLAQVPGETPIFPTKSIMLAAEQGNLAASARPLSDNISSPKVAGILEDLAATVESSPKGVPFEVLKELRSRLGAMLSGDEMVADVNLRDVKRLYGALSDDMRNGIAGFDKNLSPLLRADSHILAGEFVDNLGYAAGSAAERAQFLPGITARYQELRTRGLDDQAILDYFAEGKRAHGYAPDQIARALDGARTFMTQSRASLGGTTVGKTVEPGSEALRAWDRAETYYRAGSDRIERVLQPLLDKKTPERAFGALLSGTKEGATVLRSTMRSLKGDEKRLVASTVLRRLGKANPSAQDALGDVFSPETYLTNWNKLSPEAKGALFEGIDPMVTKDLNGLAQAMELQRKASNVLPNRSGTASNTAFWSILNGLAGGVTGLAMGGGAAKGAMIGAGATMAAAGTGKVLAEKVFTNPRMIRWLVKQTKVPLGAIQQELVILAKDSQRWDAESRDIADEIGNTFSNVDWRTMGLATAVADATR